MKYSNFHVTVNFNVDSEQHLDRLRRTIDTMADSDHLWLWLKHYDGGEQVDFTPPAMAHVDRVRIRAAFEHEGRHNRGLHVHILIEVAHTTMVQINKYQLCQLFYRSVGLNPNVHCRFLKGNGEDKDFILHYITKEVPTYRAENQHNDKLRYAFSGRNEEQEVDELV